MTGIKLGAEKLGAEKGYICKGNASQSTNLMDYAFIERDL